MSTVSVSSAASSSCASKAAIQRRPSSIRQGPPLSRSVSVVDSTSASGGRDVTSTSPSKTSMTLRPLPPPTLYQPSLLDDGSRTRTPSPLANSAPASPTPSESSSSSFFAGNKTHKKASNSATNSSSSSSSNGNKVKENTGRWLTEEHEVFLKGLNEHGKQWKKIAVMIQTRSVVQVRTHAQKYFQKLLKSERTKEGDLSYLGKERSASILSTASTSVAAGSTNKRKSSGGSSAKGNNNSATTTTTTSKTTTKKRRVSLDPKPSKKQYASLSTTTMTMHHPPQLMATAPPMPMEHTAVIDPSFMNTLHMAEGELDDSILDLLDDSSVEAVEQVIGVSNSTADAATMDEMDLEPNVVEPNPVSPSVSSMSLAAGVNMDPTPVIGGLSAVPPPMMTQSQSRHEMVTSPQPEDFSIHNTIGTGGSSGCTTSNTTVPHPLDHSPTSVACVMGVEDFEQKTASNGNTYVDALDWLMDVGVHQLPATANEEEEEEDWGHMKTRPMSVVNGDAF